VVHRRLPFLLAPILVACGPPRVAKVGSGSDGAGTSEGTTDPGWDDETTAQPMLDDDAEAGEGDEEGPRYDVMGTGKLDIPPFQNDCPDPLPSTAVEGETALGSFNGIHAYFGDAFGEIELFLYDENADLDAELNYAGWNGPSVDVGPAIRGAIWADWDQLPQQQVFSLAHVTEDEELWFMADVTITEVEFEDGDPYVPSVVHGTIAPWPQDATDAVSGPFSASRCDVFEVPFPIE
jgi:hypothetical protein